MCQLCKNWQSKTSLSHKSEIERYELSNGVCGPCLMLSTIVMCHNMLQLAKKAFVPERTMKAVLHPSPFTVTAPLSKPRHVAVRAVSSSWGTGLGHKGFSGAIKPCDVLGTFNFCIQRGLEPEPTFYSNPRCLLESHSVNHMPPSSSLS